MANLENTHKVLSDLSVDIMMGRVESIAVVYVKSSDKTIMSHYDTNGDADIFSLIGGLEMLKTRVLFGSVNLPETGGFSDDVDDENDREE